MSTPICDHNKAEHVAATIKAIGHPLRLRILALLTAGDYRVNDLVDRLGVSQSSVSHHLNILRVRGVVSMTREGTSSWYALSDPQVKTLMRNIDLAG